jgi:hypothetical protein
MNPITASLIESLNIAGWLMATVVIVGVIFAFIMLVGE